MSGLNRKQESTMNEPKELTRQELYDLVWARPMTKVATDLGISDVGLKKVCAKHRIPVPGRGYWAKLEADRPVKQVRLHQVGDPNINRIIIRGAPERRLPLEVQKAKRQAVASEKMAEKKVTVTGGDATHHPVAVQTAKMLEKAKMDDQGLCCAHGPKCFPVSVAPVNIPRAIAIIDALANAAEQRGYMIDAEENSVCLRVNGEQIGFSFVEKVERRPHKPTPEEIARREQAQRARSWEAHYNLFQLGRQQWDYFPTGTLALELDQSYHDGLRRRWSDGKTQRLEDLLNDFFAGVVAYAAAEKVRREERERWKRELEEAERRRVVQEQRRQREASRREFLVKRMGAWEKAERIDRFIQAIQPQRLGNDADIKLQKFFSWGRGYAEGLRLQCNPEKLAAALAGSCLFDPDEKIQFDEDQEQEETI